MTNRLSLERYSKQDIRLAKARCLKMSKRHKLDLPSLATSSVLSVVTPVYDEDVSRLKKQINAFNQQSIDPKLVELVYIVNNPNRTKASASAVKNNDAALTYLKKAKSKMPIIIIDRSTKGHELEIGNVGEARNTAIHAVALRYLEQKRDGILFQTDADTLPMKKNFFANIVKEVPQDKCVGASGGVRFVLSMDSKKKSDHAFIAKHLKTLNQYVQWYFLVKALHHPGLKPEVTPTRFSGANTITLAIASICAGGIPPLFAGSDFCFSYNMDAYAEKNGYFILPRRDQWIIATSFRESRRTKNGMGSYFETMKANNGKPMVKSRHSPSRTDFMSAKVKDLDKLLLLAQTHFKNDAPAVRSLVKKLKQKKNHAARLALALETVEKDKTKTLNTFFGKLYLKENPLVPLTNSEFVALKKQIFNDPLRRPFAENAIKYFATFHLN